MAKTNEKKRREQKKKSMQEARRKLKLDPDKLEEVRRKDRERKKEQRKIISQVSDREARLIRKGWRERTQKSREKRRVQAQEAARLADTTPPGTPEREIAEHEHLEVFELPLPSSSRKRSGEKIRRRNMLALKKEIKRLNAQVEKLERSKMKYKQKFYRQKASKSFVADDTPMKTVNQLLPKVANNDNLKNVRKELLFGAVIKKQIKANYESLDTRKKKSLATVLSGRVVKKYKLLHIVRNITSLRAGRKHEIKAKQSKNEGIKQAVITFLEQDINSRMRPGKKETRTVKGLKKQKRLLCDTMINLCKKFNDEFPEFSVPYSTFCKFKPSWVLAPDHRDRETCLCMIHGNADLMIKKAHVLRILQSSGITSTVRQLVCVTEGEKMKIECLERKCSTCQKNELLISADPPESEIKISQWRNKKVEILTKDKKTKIVRKCVKEDVTFKNVNEFVLQLKKYVKLTLMPHMANQYHQFQAITGIKENLGESDVMIQCDFSENYKCKYAEEVQSVHFGGSRSQISLHTVVVYMKDSCLSFCTLADDLRHNPAAICAHLIPVMDNILEMIPQVKNLHFVSDGPTNQYRNKSMFYFGATALAKKMKATSVHWHFSEAGHGKGSVDGVGGCVKRTADRLVGEGGDIPHLLDLKKELDGNCPGIKIFSIPIEEIVKYELLLPRELSTFKGTFKVHEWVWNSSSPRVISFRRLTCTTCGSSANCSHFGLGTTMIYSPCNNTKLSVDDIYSDSDSEVDKSVEYQVDNYVLVEYESNFFPGKVVKLSKENVSISCMERCNKGDAWKWPKSPDLLEYSWEDVKKKLSPPKTISKRGFFKFAESF